MHLEKKKGSSVGKTNFFLRKLHCSRVYSFFGFLLLFCCFCCNVVHTLLVCLKCLGFLWFIRVLVLFLLSRDLKKNGCFWVILVAQAWCRAVWFHTTTRWIPTKVKAVRVCLGEDLDGSTRIGFLGIQKGGSWVDLLLCLMMLFSPCKGRDGHTNIFKRLQMNL